jgi:hypothetical protein
MLFQLLWLLMADQAAPLSAQTSLAIVARSEGPSAPRYPVGSNLQVLTLSLQPLDRVVVIQQRGATELVGPGAFDLASSSPTQNLREAYASLLVGRAPRRTSFAGIRNIGQLSSLGLWHLDVDRTKVFCLPPGQPPTLWRERAPQQRQLAIWADASTAEQLKFDPWRSEALWPSALPTVGAVFVGDPIGLHHQVILKAVDVPIPGRPDEFAAQLAEAGCTEQLERLGSSLLQIQTQASRKKMSRPE